MQMLFCSHNLTRNLFYSFQQRDVEVVAAETRRLGSLSRGYRTMGEEDAAENRRLRLFSRGYYGS
jgi:hypothetical protein